MYILNKLTNMGSRLQELFTKSDCYTKIYIFIIFFFIQVCAETVHECTEFCEELHCQARARSVDAVSSDPEDDTPPEPDAYVATHAETLLPSDFLAHFPGHQPAADQYHDMLKMLIEDFAKVSERN